MSFILDALKKSEQERTRQQTPSLLELPYGKPSRAVPLWLLLVVGLLLLNFAVLLLLWWRQTPVNSPPAPMTATTQTSDAGTTVRNASSALPPMRTADPVRPLADEVTPGSNAEPDLAATTLAAAPSIPAGTQLIRVAGTDSTASPVSTATPLSTTQTLDNVTTLDSLGGSAALNLPTLHLDLHVYAADPKQRFVFINNKRYQVGAQLSEGPTVDSITPDGAILSYHGRRFLLPR